MKTLTKEMPAVQPRPASEERPGRLKVLLAEDSAVTRRRMEATVERRGHSVHAVADGAAAWEMAERGEPDLVILDWQMPELDGIEVLRRIRAAGRDTFVLMVTVRESAADLAQALDLGVDDYIMKPVTAAHLEAHVSIAERRIAQNRARRAAEEALAEARWLAGIRETTATIEHEINNPLFALLMEAQALEESLSEPSEQREQTAAIIEQARRIGNVVKHLRALQKPRAVEFLPGVAMLDLSEARKGA